MSGGISVVICCHDSAARLPQTLQHLAEQDISKDYPWEVLVVDNASTDETASVAVKCWPTEHPAPLRVVFEPKPGTGNARDRGMAEAKYEIISFVDDDNWVGPDWVSKVDAFFLQHPHITAVGGPSRGAFNVTPPSWFDLVAVPYAVGPQFPADGDITNEHGTLLWTTGMSLRRKAANDLFAKGFRFESRSTGQRGQDTELCFGLRAAGARLYYDSSMLVEHFVPANRLTWSYALKHSYVNGENSPVFEVYLMALKNYPYDNYPAWKMTWPYQTAKTIFGLITVCVLHPVDCLLLSEGSIYALRLKKILGQLSTLRKLCGEYAATQKRIRTAAWARVLGA